MKRITSALLILLLLSSFVVAETSSEKSRELNKIQYFWMTKIRHPSESFMAFFTKQREQVRFKHISEKQEILEQVTYIKDKERVLNDLKGDIEDIEAKNGDKVITSGLSLIKDDLQKQENEIKASVNQDQFFALLKTKLILRQGNPVYMNFARQAFPNSINLQLPDKGYTLMFDSGRYGGFFPSISPSAPYTIELSYADVAELTDALEHDEYNRFDSLLADRLPAQARYAMKDILQEKMSNTIKGG